VAVLDRSQRFIPEENRSIGQHGVSPWQFAIASFSSDQTYQTLQMKSSTTELLNAESNAIQQARHDKQNQIVNNTF
jgi:hypothetical protein